ncbi:MAG TPA: glycoside hydrolase family 97 N-terminal domain-containing protein, partial [Bryobacteraceae bacterium]|nr:glycoside hydrolase family 97 N-terminal domain-containing protein [Bryobacteraceae bacterium]
MSDIVAKMSSSIFQALFLSTLTLVSGCAALAQSSSATLRSPNGQLAITFQTVDKQTPSSSGQLTYAVQFQGKPLVDRSALSLDLQSQRPLGAAVRIVKATPSSQDKTYRLVTGKASEVRDHYNALRIELEEPAGMGRQLVMEARAYDDAIAFRYVVPEQRALRNFRLTQEHTEFRISKDATTYALELPNFSSMYESEYVKLPITAFTNQGGVASNILIGCPLLMDIPGVAWMAITEANLRDYSSMYLVNPSHSWAGHWLESRLAPQEENPELAVTGALPHHSAWRVLLVGAEPGRLVESNVITSLNPPSEIKDTSWIHAGNTSWDWWSGSVGPDGKP